MRYSFIRFWSVVSAAVLFAFRVDRVSSKLSNRYGQRLDNILFRVNISIYQRIREVHHDRNYRKKTV